MKRFILSILLLSFFYSASQSYIGHTTDNYAGIHAVTFNPANIVSSKFKTDINLVSVSVFGGSDYFDINIGDLSDVGDNFNFEDDVTTTPSNDNTFFFNADVILPSFMFNLSPRSSIGMINRVRAFTNTTRINGLLFENVVNDFDDNEDFEFNSQDLASVNHAWAEIGLAYGRILIDKPKNMLSGGVTLKYLLGGGATYFNTPDLTGDYAAASETLNTSGFLYVGSSFDTGEEFEFSLGDAAGGFGLDIGFNYEYHPDRLEDDGLRHYQSDYKFKIGVSVTDIGSISYDNSSVIEYDLNASVNTNALDGDIREFLDNNYEGKEENASIKINLPTALHLMFDYRLGSNFLLNAQANISLVGDGEFESNRVINTYTFTPRYQTRWLSVLAPVSIREHGDFAFGAGLRIGPVSIGSASIFSNLLSDNSQTTDVFIGFKIPIYRGNTN